MPTVWIVLFALAFPIFWAGVVWGIGLMGWHPLAAHFRDDDAEADDILWVRFTTGRVGMSSYSSTLHVGVADAGLYLRVPALFRPGHPPLRIPWDAITEVRPRTVLGYTTYGLRIGEPHIATIRVPERVIRALRDHRPGLGG